MRFWDRIEHHHHPALGVVMAPIWRLRFQDLPDAAKMAGILVGVLQAIVHDLSFGIFGLMILSGVMDTIYGRRVARAMGEYDQIKAEIGLQSKFMGLAIALLIRGFELWLATWTNGSTLDGWQTHGALAAAIAATLFVQDISSIQEKRERYGQGKIPVLGHILTAMSRVATALGAPQPDAKPNRRKDDDGQ